MKNGRLFLARLIKIFWVLLLIIFNLVMAIETPEHNLLNVKEDLN